MSSCVCPNTTTNHEEMHRPAGPQHRVEFEAVKNHLQLQPDKAGALHCLAQKSAPCGFLLLGDFASLAPGALLLCHKRVLALRHRHRNSQGRREK